MARCDQGYLCELCGEEVKSIRDSDLYLRYVTGQLSGRDLLASPERHIRCNPVAAQFITTDEFPEVIVDGPFSKMQLDDQYVAEQTELMTRGWQRLQELVTIAQSLPLSAYPLPEFRT